MRDLLDAGADPRAEKDGMTPMDFAEAPNDLGSAEGKLEAARLLRAAMEAPRSSPPPEPAPAPVSSPSTTKPASGGGQHEWEGNVCRICGCIRAAATKFGWGCDGEQRAEAPAKAGVSTSDSENGNAGFWIVILVALALVIAGAVYYRDLLAFLG